MRDDHNCNLPALHALYGVEQQPLTLIVETGIRIIKDHERRVAIGCARQSQLLALRPQKQGATFADIGFVSLRQSHDRLMQPDELGSFDNLTRIRAVEPTDDIFDRTAEKFNILRQIADMASIVAMAKQ